VVFHRLKQSGLEQLCSLIHDSQTDKKAFISDLKVCYEQWVAATDDGDAQLARRTTLVDALAAQQHRIDAFEAAMAHAPAELGGRVRDLVRRIAALPEAPVAGPALREALPALAVWDSQRDLTRRLHHTVKERFGRDSLSGHPFALLQASLLQDQTSYVEVERLCNDVEALLTALDPVLENADGFIRADTGLQQACIIAAESRRLADAGLAGHLDLLDTASPRTAPYGASAPRSSKALLSSHGCVRAPSIGRKDERRRHVGRARPDAAHRTFVLALVQPDVVESAR
jgi:hypothetical protein